MGQCSCKTDKGADDEGVDPENVEIDVPFDGTSFQSNYRLGKELGEGAFSLVREGIHKKTGGQYAVKCIKREGLPPEDEEDLMEEVRILRMLNHPNIVDIYQFFQDDRKYYYVVIEFMRGGELFDRIVQKVTWIGIGGFIFFGMYETSKSVLGPLLARPARAS